MDSEVIQYIKDLIPKGFIDGRVALQEGIEMGQDVEVGRSSFLDKFGYDNYLEYRKANTKKGKTTWQLLLGLSTLEEQLEALQTIDEFSDRTGLDIRTVQSIPSQLVGLPKEYWEGAPKPTSYLMDGPEDWIAHNEAAPIQMVWQDWHLSSPDNLQLTKNALAAGTARIGTFSQLIWEFPGYTDEETRFSDMVRSLGILNTKKDHYITADTYPEDGMAGYFMDVASFVGYELLEHYIIEELCGAKMSLSYGGLLTEIQPRMAFALAMDKLLSTEDEPILSYYNGGTLDQWDHDVNANFGTGVQEMLIQILFEKKYQLHTAMSPVSVTEALRVPTLQELLEIAAAGRRAEEKADQWAPLINWEPIETLSEELIHYGKLFYQNIMDAFEEAGVDTKDPLEMIVVISRFNPVEFEEAFHPSIQEFGEFRPYVPTVIGRQAVEKRTEIVNDLKENGFDNSLAGKDILVVSADGHSYGLTTVVNILEEVGANVVNGGVDMEAYATLDLADEEGIDLIAISVHCGQLLDYNTQIRELAKKRGKTYKFIFGGMLNSMVPGHTEPIDVSSRVNETGSRATNELEETIRYFTE